MILYHGTTRDFDKFLISKDLVATRHIENLVEGMGIYFTENHEFAKSYGNIIYSVNLENEDCWDFTNKKTMPQIVSLIEKKTNFPIHKFMLDSAFLGILEGDISIRNFPREISLELDSTESFYYELGDRDSEKLFEEIEKEYNNILYSKKFFKYYDKSFQSCVYLCTNREDTLKILNKERVD